MNILMLGCGALGSRIAVELVGHRLYLLDMDRVGNENIPTSAYFMNQVGQTKVAALSELCYRRGIWTYTIHKEFDWSFLQPLGEPMPDLVVCTFDTAAARRAAATMYGRARVLLHAGVSGDRAGCVGLHGDYPMPGVDADLDDNVVCTHLLGLPILSMTALVAAQYIRYFDGTGSVAGPVFVNSFGVAQHEHVRR